MDSAARDAWDCMRFVRRSCATDPPLKKTPQSQDELSSITDRVLSPGWEVQQGWEGGIEMSAGMNAATMVHHPHSASRTSLGSSLRSPATNFVSRFTI